MDKFFPRELSSNQKINYPCVTLTLEQRTFMASSFPKPDRQLRGSLLLTTSTIIASGNNYINLGNYLEKSIPMNQTLTFN